MQSLPNVTSLLSDWEVAELEFKVMCTGASQAVLRNEVARSNDSRIVLCSQPSLGTVLAKESPCPRSRLFLGDSIQWLINAV